MEKKSRWTLERREIAPHNDIKYTMVLLLNCIGLGLTVGVVAAILSEKDLGGCFLFSLALNHKQVLMISMRHDFDQALVHCDVEEKFNMKFKAASMSLLMPI
ncbi:Alpha-1,3-glucosyltransferase [Quillaja saponaria]|uniref:Alpha-1,3-glucosyltransferase n=1 Tax=Quillaja saponaria TaxID=32244 RepID=A0AAD7KWR6_QUISA|nr:Alpha-1,3-glucosyltransferase [Quillaja saponaria]